MINVYYSLAVGAEPVTENVVSIADILASTDTCINIIVNIIVIIGGILGFNYVRKLREKQVDSTFSYLTKLNVRLKYFHDILVTYKDEVMDRFLPEDCRREVSAERTYLVADIIKQLTEYAKETMNFLRDEDNQLPAQKGWISCFNSFIEFLIDCEQLDQVTYFKWTDRERLDEYKEQYYNDVLNNLDKLLEMVNKRQIELENEIFKK